MRAITFHRSFALSDCQHSCPFPLYQSRMQAGSEQARKYKNAFHGLATVVKEEGKSPILAAGISPNPILHSTGVGALYNGISSKLVQSVLTAAFLFASKVSDQSSRQIFALHTRRLTTLRTSYTSNTGTLLPCDESCNPCNC